MPAKLPTEPGGGKRGRTTLDTILLVDDELVILEVLEGMLQSESWRIICATSAAEAREQVRTNAVDVALIDKNLPDGSGVALIADLKALRPDLEALILTGYGSMESAIDAIRAGAMDYVLKPVEDFFALGVKLQNAVARSRLLAEQRRLLQELSESDGRYRQIFDTSADALVLLDEGGRVLSANPSAERMFGRSGTVLSGQPAERLFAPGPSDGLVKPLSSAGEETVAELSSVPFLRNGVSGRLLTLRDITARRKADEERRTLEQQVRHAQKMEAVGRLAGGIAHDFNNILTVVLGYAEILQRQLDTDDQRGDLALIVKGAESAVGLTRQLLAFSRKRPAEAVLVNVNKAVAEVEKLLRRSIGEDITLVVKLALDAWPIYGDADQILQVLLNLAVNARDAMPNGGRLLIETSNQVFDEHAAALRSGTTPGDYLCLSVSDNGTGMSREILAQIFEPFFTTKELGKGTGLGLAIVHGIAHESGGAVRAYSELGLGTSFRVYLPRALTGAPQPMAAKTREAPARARAGETVLIAEDEEPVRSLLRKVLLGHGYQVVEGVDGRHALAAARAHPGLIHLLITDLVMPHLPGRELALALGDERPEMKVLFMSGYTEHAAVANELIASDSGFMQKPFTGDILLASVRRVLDPS